MARVGLPDTARVWAAAIPYAPADPSAAAAMRMCEDRLRVIHPYTMARYDRLRAEGTGPIDAMREAVPLFARHPGQPAPARHLAVIVMLNMFPLACPAALAGAFMLPGKQAPGPFYVYCTPAQYPPPGAPQHW